MREVLQRIALLFALTVMIVCCVGLATDQPTAPVPGPAPVAAEQLVLPPTPEIARAMAFSSVWRMSHGDDGPYGSAVPIACNPTGDLYVVIFLTARHLTDGATNFVATCAGRRLTDGSVRSRHATLDVSLIGFPSKEPVRVVGFTTTAPPLGADVWKAGYGSMERAGFTPWVSRGCLSGARRITAPIIHGDSGGGIFDEHGLLVGIVSAVEYYSNDDKGIGKMVLCHHAFFTPVTMINEWLTASLR